MRMILVKKVGTMKYTEDFEIIKLNPCPAKKIAVVTQCNTGLLLATLTNYVGKVVETLGDD